MNNCQFCRYKAIQNIEHLKARRRAQDSSPQDEVRVIKDRIVELEYRVDELLKQMEQQNG